MPHRKGTDSRRTGRTEVTLIKSGHSDIMNTYWFLLGPRAHDNYLDT